MISLQYRDGFAIHQYESATGTLVSPPSWADLPPHPSRLSQSIDLGCPASSIKLPAFSMLHMVMYVLQCSSLKSALPLLLLLSPKVWSLCLLCYPAHQYHLSRFHIYALIYDIWFSLSDLLYSVIGSRFIHLIRSDSCWCIAEANTILWSNFPSIKNK